MPRERNIVTADLTNASILRFFGLVLLVLLLWQVRNVVAIVLFSIIFASAITPFVNALHRRRVPRALGITFMYLLFLGALTVILILFGKLLGDQVRELAANFPSFYRRVVDFFLGAQAIDSTLPEAVQRWLESVSQSLLRFSGQIITGTVSLFGGFFSFVGILVLTFYTVLQEDGVKRFINAIAPATYIPYLTQLIDRIQLRLGGWFRGQLMLSVIIGAMSFLGLTILGVDYAFSLALIAGLSELVPVAGPIIGAVPAVLVAFSESPLLAALVALLYLVIQQLENNLIVPKVMQRFTGLNPIVTIVAVLIGATLAGFVGVLLAIPITLIIYAFFEDFFQESDARSSSGEPPPTEF